MAMGRRRGGRQKALFVAAAGIRAPGHPFYRALEGLLASAGFDGWCEETCAAHYAQRLGRPSIPPGVYFRMLVVGYLEGIGSERGIAWRCAESLSLREFLGYELDENPPDHSTVSRTRRRLPVEAHEAVFAPGAGAAGGERASERQDAGDRLDDAGGERGDAVDRAAGHGGRDTSCSWRAWPRRRGSRRRAVRIWRSWTGSGRGRGPTMTGSTRTIRTRGSRR